MAMLRIHIHQRDGTTSFALMPNGSARWITSQMIDTF